MSIRKRLPNSFGERRRWAKRTEQMPIDMVSASKVFSTRILDLSAPAAAVNVDANPLVGRFASILDSGTVSWTAHYRLLKRLGAGGQGVVFQAEWLGAHNARWPVAVKVFSPQPFATVDDYHDEMERLSRVATRLAKIQHDNLIDVHNVMECDGVSLMVMEYVDGFDLQRLLEPDTLRRIQSRVTADRWAYLNDVVITTGPVHSRLKPGMAIAILRECLAGLAATHRAGVIHGDLKPANIMLKRTGNAKLIDFGSAFLIKEPASRRTWTPRYAGVEVLLGGECQTTSDLASLGYVLVELLIGRPLFGKVESYADLIQAKTKLPDELHALLPDGFAEDDVLVRLIHRLIHPEPLARFPSAEAADLTEDFGAAAFQRHLVKGDLSVEYENEIRLWLRELD